MVSSLRSFVSLSLTIYELPTVIADRKNGSFNCEIELCDNCEASLDQFIYQCCFLVQDGPESRIILYCYGDDSVSYHNKLALCRQQWNLTLGLLSKCY